VSTDHIAPTIAELLARIDDLTRRIEWLEAGQHDGPHPPTTVSAVAAYLGKRAKVRQIHLRGTTSWAQQGRAAVMGSHAVQHGPPHAPHGPH
jgi:methylmalonyl-CoA carboxyltransferase large subunit